MKTSKIKEIANIIIFIKDLKKTEIAERCSFSYTTLTGFLTRHSKMLFENMEELFDVLDFPFLVALKLAEKHYNRKELIEKVLLEIKEIELLKEQQ